MRETIGQIQYPKAAHSQRGHLCVQYAYDGVSAKLIQRAGFKAIQCSGHSISLTKAYQEERLLSADENVSRTKEITDAVHVPVMADAEDGYGHGGVFRSNLLKFIRTGIAGINIEDQNLWDPYETERIVPAKVMLDKIGMVLQTKGVGHTGFCVERQNRCSSR